MIETTCQCCDFGCTCEGRCRETATMLLTRIDYVDIAGTLMCNECSQDTMETGVFTCKSLP